MAPKFLENFMGRASGFMLEPESLRGFKRRAEAGTVVAIEDDTAIIHVPLKARGTASAEGYIDAVSLPDLNVGDTVEVYRVDSASGRIRMKTFSDEPIGPASRDETSRDETWARLEQAFENNATVEGVVVGPVKGGFTVDLGGVVAFLPGSHVGVGPAGGVAPLFMNVPMQLQILKIDSRRRNVIVSRRTVLEQARAGRQELVQNLAEGQVVDGVVKTITDYGAFIDVGGIVGFLHITDMAAKRIKHPSEMLAIGEHAKVKIIRINPETQRISLSMKQLQADPWEDVAARFPVGARVKGRVTQVTDYGAFIELAPGVDGLLHAFDLSWTRKDLDPGKTLSIAQDIEVQVLEADPAMRRISLGLKQTMPNPWKAFAETHPPGTTVEGRVRGKTRSGLFLNLENDLYGAISPAELDRTHPGEPAIGDLAPGEPLTVQVLDVDVDNERISLGVKARQEAPETTSKEVGVIAVAAVPETIPMEQRAYSPNPQILDLLHDGLVANYAIVQARADEGEPVPTPTREQSEKLLAPRIVEVIASRARRIALGVAPRRPLVSGKEFDYEIVLETYANVPIRVDKGTTFFDLLRQDLVSWLRDGGAISGSWGKLVLTDNDNIDFEVAAPEPQLEMDWEKPSHAEWS